MVRPPGPASHCGTARTKDALTPFNGCVGRTAVLFVCVHNAGRSQMAAGFLRHLAGDRVEVLSAGTEPAAEVNPVAVQAMAEKGVDLSDARPRALADSAVREADVVITMGCGDACPFYPGKRYEDWTLEDPAGKSVEQVRPIRNEIDRRVLALLADLTSDANATT